MGIEPQISCVENDYFANANDLLMPSYVKINDRANNANSVKF